MEALVAVSLAGNVITFFDFGTKIVLKAREIHNSTSGATAENEDLSQMSERLKEIVLELKNAQPGHEIGGQVSTLTLLVAKCIGVSDELQNLLEDLRAKKSTSKPRKLWLASRSVWKKDLVDSLKDKLEGHQRELQLYLTSKLFCTSNLMFEQLVCLAKSSQEKLAVMQRTIDAFEPTARSQGLSPDAEATLKNVLAPLTKSTRHVRADRILSGLRFASVNDRLNDIARAQPGGFDWLFRDDELNVEGFDKKDRERMKKARSNFMRWLRQDSGIFQLCGKPGSGKSTLMKHLCGHPQTIANLEEWARLGSTNKSLAIGKFFLWKHGTKEQNSWSGVVRGLLYSVTSNSPDLIPVLFPEEWKASSSDREIVFNGFHSLDRAFEILCSGEVYKTHKLAIFIDGLDEYEDNDTSLVEKLLSWVNGNSEVKICVSNRELPEFRICPNYSAQIRLHEVNHGDIASLVRTRLTKNPHFQGIGNEYERRDLLRYIIARSDGVFLWVTLVLRNLDEGLYNGDSLDVLWQKVQTLPTKLNKLFEHLLDSVNSDNLEEAYGFLAMALACSVPWPLFRFSFLGDYLCTQEFANHAMLSLSQDEVEKRLDLAQRKISGYCKGLLEVSTDGQQTERTFEAHVKFTHRSTVDFIRSKVIVQRMAKELGDFDPFRALCQTFLAHVKSVGHDLAGYASASIWKSPDGVSSFECDVYHLLRLNKSQPPTSEFPDLLSQAVVMISGEHQEACAAFQRRLVENAPDCLKLNLSEMVMILAALHGVTDDVLVVRQRTRERARVYVGVLCLYLAHQMEDPTTAFPVLKRYFQDTELSPNEPFPGEKFSCWHYFFSYFIQSLFFYDAARSLPHIAFFLLMGADPRVFVTMTPKKQTSEIQVSISYGKKRIFLRQFEVYIGALSLVPELADCLPSRRDETEVPLTTLVQHLFPDDYKCLQGVIEWMLLRNGSITAEHRAELSELFGKPLNALISRANRSSFMSADSSKAAKSPLLSLLLLANKVSLEKAALSNPSSILGGSLPVEDWR